jgi:hypothetical protein
VLIGGRIIGGVLDADVTNGPCQRKRRDQVRIPWPVVFAKAYALVAAETPLLRRVYV